MTAEEYEKVMTAEFAWQEEGDNSINAVLGVMFVLRNRIDAGWHHGSWIENINHAKEHSPGQRTTGDHPQPNEPNFEKILHLVDSVYDGSRKDNLTGGAMYWARPMRVDITSAFYRNIMNHPEKYPRTGSITGTVFYGEVDDPVPKPKL